MGPGRQWHRLPRSGTTPWLCKQQCTRPYLLQIHRVPQYVVLPSNNCGIGGDSRGSGTLSAYLRPMRSPWGRGRGQRRQPLRTPTARTRRSREIAQLCKYVQCVRQTRTSAIIAGRSWRNSPHCHNGSPSSTSGEGTSERLARAEPTEPQKGTMDADDYPPAEYSSAACQINE
jgi:hypothetical protein